jgi:hypothetical protein
MTKSEYKTTDIVLAASLVVHGNKMVKIEVQGSRGTFVFEDVEQDFLDEYELSKCQVEPVEFNNAIKRLTTSVRRMTQVR